MKFYLTDTHELKEITVRHRIGSGYGPDCFSKLEVIFPLIHDHLYGDNAHCCTAEEYDNLVEWWEDGIRRINAREKGSYGAEYEELYGDELVLFAD